MVGRGLLCVSAGMGEREIYSKARQYPPTLLGTHASLADGKRRIAFSQPSSSLLSIPTLLSHLFLSAAPHLLSMSSPSPFLLSIPSLLSMPHPYSPLLSTPPLSTSSGCLLPPSPHVDKELPVDPSPLPLASQRSGDATLHLVDGGFVRMEQPPPLRVHFEGLLLHSFTFRTSRPPFLISHKIPLPFQPAHLPPWRALPSASRPSCRLSRSLQPPWVRRVQPPPPMWSSDGRRTVVTICAQECRSAYVCRLRTALATCALRSLEMSRWG